MTVIYPPVAPDPRMNWRAWVAAGTVVPPREARRRGIGGLVFILLVTGLIAVGMAAQVWK